MIVLGVIPARGGSKGIPRKNLAPLGGRPLLAYSCDAARASATLTRVIVSTDDADIARTADRFGVEVPFLRPAALASDATPMLDVLLDLLATLDAREAYRPDVVVLLQPTSPFRRAEHIDGAVRLLQASGADSVVSVVTVPHQFTPASLLQIEGERLVPAGGTIGPTRRQDKPALFARNGPAVLAVRRSTLIDQGMLYGTDVRPLVMAREDSIDIDDAFDLQVAEMLLSAGRTPA
jgi:CMP-N-acetylneuraminic acid synthetase